jgi:dihydrofolate synthase/folylpolyglutamate synthase
MVPPLDHDVPLAGAHQRQNAALAIAGARLLEPNIGEEAVARGLERVKWPGRFEVLGNVVLDGAHNGASAEALSATLRAYAAGRPVSLVVGINRDKDARAVLRPLLALADRVWATQTASNPRALEASALARLCRRLGAQTTTEPDLPAALRLAMSNARGIVCVTGSLMLVGQARAILGMPAPESLW